GLTRKSGSSNPPLSRFSVTIRPMLPGSGLAPTNTTDLGEKAYSRLRTVMRHCPRCAPGRKGVEGDQASLGTLQPPRLAKGPFAFVTLPNCVRMVTEICHACANMCHD